MSKTVRQFTMDNAVAALGVIRQLDAKYNIPVGKRPAPEQIEAEVEYSRLVTDLAGLHQVSFEKAAAMVWDATKK